ncbi:MAG: SOS response-associated peptidase, partial [Actinomycetia bacterium]|nr:SOS response-associated peptidase [Actinomycetes bacterium]
MCGRFAVTTDPALLAEKINAIDEATGQVAPPAERRESPADPPAPNYNVAPTQTISVLVKRHTEPGDESTRRIRRMRWGLIPPWVRATADGGPDTKGPLLINARSETVTSSPAFRASAKSKRCLVPMNGWYEWTRTG